METKGPLDTQVVLEKAGPRDHLGHLDDQVRKAKEELQVNWALTVVLAARDLWVTLDLPASRDDLEIKVPRENQDPQDPLASVDGLRASAILW